MLCTSAGDAVVKKAPAMRAAAAATATRACRGRLEGRTRRASIRRRIAARSTGGMTAFIRRLRISVCARVSSNMWNDLQVRGRARLDEGKCPAKGPPGEHQTKPDRRSRRAQYGSDLMAVETRVVAKHHCRALRLRQRCDGGEDIQPL